MANTGYDIQYKLEQEVLSIYIVDVNILKESDSHELFNYPQHKNIYKALKQSINENVIDVMKLYTLITEEEFNYYMSLMETYVTSVNYERDLARLEDSYRKRRILEMSDELKKEYITFDYFVKGTNKLNEEYSSFRNSFNIDKDDIYHLLTTVGKELVFTDYANMQSKLHLMDSTLNVIAARPSVGKSAYALNLFNDLSKSKDNRCIYINMEMTEREIYQRLVGMNTGIAISNFENCDPNGKTSTRIKDTLDEISRRNIRIVNKPVSIGYIEKLMQSEKRNKDNVGKHIIYFIDYLGYISSKNKSNDRERLGEIVRQLQIFTKTYDSTIFLLAQINRQGDEQPSMINLKDTGELEQSAHCCMILSDMNEQDYQARQHLMRVLIGKNRSGYRNGYLEFIYTRDCQKFTERAK